MLKIMKIIPQFLLALLVAGILRAEGRLDIMVGDILVFTHTILEYSETKLICPIPGTNFTWRLSNKYGPLIVTYYEADETYKTYGPPVSNGKAEFDPVTGTLTFPSVQLIDENTYFCDRGRHTLTSALIVQVIPDQVTLQPEPPNDFVASGTIISSQCVLERVKPAASNLSWTLNGEYIKGQGDMTTEVNADGTFKHTRRLDLTLTPVHHGKVLMCHGFVDETKVTSVNVTLQVGSVTTIEETKRAELPCPVSGSDPYTWRLNAASGPLIVQYDVIDNTYRYYGVLARGQADMDPITGTLTFSSVQLSDENTYFCVRAKESVINKLIVQVIPDQVNLQPQPPNDYVASGSTISSQCVIERTKPAASNLSWLLQGKNIEGQGDMTTEDNEDGTFRHTRRLDLTLTPDHHGKILSCRGHDGDKWITSKSVTLLVGFIPEHVNLQPEPPNDYVASGSTISSQCVIERTKPVASSLSWLLQGKNIEEQGNMTTENNGDGTFKHTRRLDLALTPDHHGKKLSCRGQVGDKWITSKSVTLLVGFIPEQVTFQTEQSPNDTIASGSTISSQYKTSDGAQEPQDQNLNDRNENAESTDDYVGYDDTSCPERPYSFERPPSTEPIYQTIDEPEEIQTSQVVAYESPGPYTLPSGPEYQTMIQPEGTQTPLTVTYVSPGPYTPPPDPEYQTMSQPEGNKTPQTISYESPGPYTPPPNPDYQELNSPETV